MFFPKMFGNILKLTLSDSAQRGVFNKKTFLPGEVVENINLCKESKNTYFSRKK